MMETQSLHLVMEGVLSEPPHQSHLWSIADIKTLVVMNVKRVGFTLKESMP